MKINDQVMVWRDPRTKTDDEGIAVVKDILGLNGDKFLAEVQFLGSTDILQRLICEDDILQIE
jgi:hypothetical protein